MRLLLSLCILVSLPSFAGWTEKVKSQLPSKLSTLLIGKSDRDSVRKSLGKPDLVRGDKEYWTMDGFKYALELTYKKNVLETLHYNFSKKSLSLHDFKNNIDPKLLKASPTQPHTALFYEDKEGKLEIEASSGKIESVRFR